MAHGVDVQCPQQTSPINNLWVQHLSGQKKDNTGICMHSSNSKYLGITISNTHSVRNKDNAKKFQIVL